MDKAKVIEILKKEFACRNAPDDCCSAISVCEACPQWVSPDEHTEALECALQILEGTEK